MIERIARSCRRRKRQQHYGNDETSKIAMKNGSVYAIFVVSLTLILTLIAMGCNVDGFSASSISLQSRRELLLKNTNRSSHHHLQQGQQQKRRILTTTRRRRISGHNVQHPSMESSLSMRLKEEDENLQKTFQSTDHRVKDGTQCVSMNRCHISNDVMKDELPSSPTRFTTSSNDFQSRRQAIMRSCSIVTGAVVVSAVTTGSHPVHAFDRSFPMELTEIDNDDDEITNNVPGSSSRRITLNNGSNRLKPSAAASGRRMNSLQRKRQAELKKTKEEENLVNFNIQNDLVPSAVWGGALWLLSGSRSNPLATPIANIVYGGENTDEQWLIDRRAGLFAPPPPAFLVLLGVVFLGLGTVTQLLVLQLSEGDSGVCSQLAGVAFINGIFFEIGRIASGEKRMTCDELDRAVELKGEFEEFAQERLVPSGNCHRSDVVKAFRRYHAKYRQADSEEYPLTDLEIERLLRTWNQVDNLGKAEMTQAGFYYGISINKDADVFV